MDDVKDKAKGIMKKLNPFSSSHKFKGEGHRLGSPVPSNTSSPRLATPNTSSSRHATQKPDEQKQQQEDWRRLQQERWESDRSQKEKKSSHHKGSKKTTGTLPQPPEALKTEMQRVAISPPQKPAQSPAEAPKPPNSAPQKSTYSSPPIALESTRNSDSHMRVSDERVSEDSVVGRVDKEELEMQVVTFLSGGASSATIEVIVRLLRNILREPKAEKFRRIRMGNPRIQETIGSAIGAMEFLQFLGFIITTEENETWTVMDEPSDYNLLLLQEAIAFLEPQLTEATVSSKDSLPAKPAGPADSGSTVSSTAVNVTKAATSVIPPDREVKIFYTPPGTAVVRADLPDSIYELSLDEVKRQGALNRKKLEDSQLLIPKSFKQKQALAARQKYKFCIIRVHFADGIVLQGVFLPQERTSAIYGFVRSALKDNQVDFELIDPAGVKSKLISSEADNGKCPTLDQADLLPTAILKLQTSSPDFSGLRSDYLARMEPLTVSPF